MAIQDVSRIVYLLILPGVIVHLCTCTIHYEEHGLESEKYCHPLRKKFSHDIRNASAVIVKSNHMFDRWVVQSDRQCRFVFKTVKGEGLFAMIQRMFFRRDGTECLDYVQFKRKDGHRTRRFCGEINREARLLVSEPYNEDNVENYYGEFDPLDRFSGAELETEIFISKEPVIDRQSLDLMIVYTPYRNCSKVDPEQFKALGRNICIRKEYICDKITNCPFTVCSDELNCPNVLISDLQPREDTATKVTVGAVTTMILCFIIFVMCLWICKRSQKLCWSSDCAGPNVCSRPGSLPRESEGSTNPGVPTAPMLEVAVSSPHGDKDLPPSYDSLFPEQGNPARS